MSGTNDEHERADAEIQRLKAELKISEEIRNNEREINQYRIDLIKNGAKFYNRDGFWLFFWIALPFFLVALSSIFS